ncbi:MAG: hypothetical protein SGI90_11930 [Candidatus Eisenbacteria bacterium]|nr:hypothetical protein [Candidatus Eisenbacteria bacterium]
MPANPHFTLVRSRLVGAPAHHDQLLQLLGAPPDYWKAQTPIPMKPVSRVAVAADGNSFTEFTTAPGLTAGQMETLLVLMSARMPQISTTFEISGAGDLAGLRLLLGKLEAGRRSADGEVTWGPLPHHSTFIGSK